jgi:hypothetical protein
MIWLAGRDIDATRFGSERAASAGAITVVALGWLVALGSLIGAVTVFTEIGWDRAPWIVILCASVPLALGLTRRVAASRRLHSIAPEPALEHRYYGSLAVITDSEERPLRPIGCTAREAAAQTGILLTDLASIPSVRIFQGVRPTDPGLPLIPHAISAGRRLFLVESVAWPPGRYEADPDTGRILCNGTYIGQSAHALRTTARQWGKLLPRNHRVTAVVVVHPAAQGAITLPAPASKDLSWVLAEDTIAHLRQRIAGHGHSVSRNAVAALMAATAVDTTASRS